MKIKFTLQRPAGPVDLVATVDSATTVGELADYLAAADPAGSHLIGPHQLTIGLAGPPPLSIDPRQTVAESGLRSGGSITLSAAGDAYADPHRASAAVLRVLDGPDAGREYPIARGASVVGRERGCEVRLSDTMVSRRHARINVTDVIEIVDLGSANGVMIDDMAVPRSILRSADVVQVGDTRLSVRLLQANGDASVPGTAVGFVRSPRLDPSFEGVVLKAPEPPERPGRQRFPLIPLIAPLLVGAALYLITRSPTSLIFVALSPIMMIGNSVESRLGGRAAYKRALIEFHEDVDSLLAEATAAAQAEAAARLNEHPSTAQCAEAVRTGNPLLWTRRPGERGFAELRLGLGSQPARNSIELPDPKRTARALFTELRTKTAPFADVSDVPVVSQLGASALGIAGPRTLALPVARSMLIQLVAQHSPAEIIMAALTSTQTAPDWDWLKWLPHSSSPHSPLTCRQLTSTTTGGAALISELEELLAHRSDAGLERVSTVPAMLVLVEDDAPVEHSRLVAIAEHGAAHGIHLIWLAADRAALPAACRTFVEVAGDGTSGSAGFVHTGVAVRPLQLATLTIAETAQLAQRLAPLIDIGARVDDASDLPRSLSLLTINGVELASSPEAVIERWTENRSILTGPFAPPTPPKHAGSLRAVIGQSANEVHALDLRTDGPHALVGGTTGSGKSELLQAWILALAAAHSPQRLTFLLVDYKGGSAFRDCIELPHTVGLVTDLSPHLVRRALTSLSAELKYREHVLATHGAKDLITLEKQGVVDTPPSLVIVVDEFAALVNEVPEFVDGVVNVAQRGRSLGLHLILATQRPAGVIKDNLRANTNLRLALRMADEEDSADVLGSPQAAFFDPALPGRAVSKTGPGRLVPFQTGYAGGWTTEQPSPPDILVEELGFGNGAVWQRPDEDAAPVELGPTDIRRLVASVAGANLLAELAPPRRPWLSELKAIYDLSHRDEVNSRRTDTELVFGVRDDPDSQAQPSVAFTPDRDGNLAVYGTGGAGKSTLLRTLAIAAGFTVRGGPCHVYGLDFGARGLSMLEELPHVGSIIAGSDHERIVRLLGWIRELVDTRALRYSRLNAGTITDYRRLADAHHEPRILLIVDGVAAFRQAYESTDRLRWFDMLTSIATDGRPVGVHVVLSSDQRAGMTTALASAVQARVVLRLAGEDDYGLLGVARDVLSASSPPGRGLFGGSEIQVAVLGGTPDVVEQAAAIRRFAESMRRAGASAAQPIEKLPDLIQLTDLPTSAVDRPVVGMSSGTLAPFTVEPRGSFIVSGPPGSGRTTTLLTLVQSLRAWDTRVRFHYLGNRRSTLASVSFWSGRAYGVVEVAEYAAKLAVDLANGLATDPLAVVIVESIGEFVSGPADVALQDLAKICIAQDQFLIVEGETSTVTGSFGFLGAAKTSRAGLALAPDQSDGTTVYRTSFPRTNRGDFPPGRALHVALGRTEVVQIAYPTKDIV